MGISLSGVSVAQRDTLDYQYHDAANNPLANTYRTRDGRFVNLAFLQSDRYWPEFCVAVDHPEWLADERFADSDARRANAKACIKLLDDLFATRPLEEWKQVLARQPGQWDVIYTPGEALAHPQVLANRYTQSVRHSGDTSVVLTSSPVRFGEESPTLGRAPTLGRDTDEALASCGVDRAEISRLRDAGIVG